MTSASPFASLGLEAKLSSNVAKLGYDSATPIQVQAIPAVLAGKDLIGLAQTGTGKTAAFALPIIQKLAAAKGTGVRALVVAPTRELAQQIVEAIKKYAEGTGIKATPIYGGVRMGSQLKRLRDGVDIVVGCPGRLLDHIQRRTLDISKIETLVLDEADHMFDMGFLPDIKKLISYAPKKRQTLLFSATMPKEIRHLAEDVLTDPQSIEVSHGEMAATVSHALFPVSADQKSQLLEKILKQFEVTSTIIFARTKQRTKRLADTLQKNGYKVACLQGNLSQARRQEAITGFRAGKFDVLVATDLAARGIDVQQVTHVINFDIPMTVDGYTHRIGRTGRAAREGEAFTLISREDEGRVRAIEKVLGAKIERRRVEGFEYGKEAYVEASQSSERRSSSERPRRSFSSARTPRGGARDAARGDRGGRPAGRPYGQDRGARPVRARPDGDRPVFKRDDRESPPRSAGARSDSRPERGAFRPRDSERSGFRSRGPGRSDDARPPRRFQERSEGSRSGPARGDRSESRSSRPQDSRAGGYRARPDRGYSSDRVARPERSRSDSAAPDRRRSENGRSENRDARPARSFDRESYGKKRGFSERAVESRPAREGGDRERRPGAEGARAPASGAGRPFRKPFGRPQRDGRGPPRGPRTR